MKFDEFNEDLGVFMEAGLIAIKQGDEESAKKLFNAVGVLEKDQTGKKMGYGLIALHKMDIKTAQQSFHEILAKEPKNWRAMAFLSFSHVLSTLKEGPADEKIAAFKQAAHMAQEVLAHCETPSTRQLAQSVLDWEADMQARATKGPAEA